MGQDERDDEEWMDPFIRVVLICSVVPVVVALIEGYFHAKSVSRFPLPAAGLFFAFLSTVISGAFIAQFLRHVLGITVDSGLKRWTVGLVSMVGGTCYILFYVYPLKS